MNNQSNNKEIFELRSQLSKLGIKCNSRPQSNYDDSILLEHYHNGGKLLQLCYQSKDVFENEGFAIIWEPVDSNDDGGIVINDFNETITFIQNKIK